LWFGVECLGYGMALAGGLVSNLSGKPTFLSVLLNDGWVAAYDPKRTSGYSLKNRKTPLNGYLIETGAKALLMLASPLP
jgi:hypothetical protein